MQTLFTKSLRARWMRPLFFSPLFQLNKAMSTDMGNAWGQDKMDMIALTMFCVTTVLNYIFKKSLYTPVKMEGFCNIKKKIKPSEEHQIFFHL